MTALRKIAHETIVDTALDMTMGHAADLMPCSNIEGGDMIGGGHAAVMPCSN